MLWMDCSAMLKPARHTLLKIYFMKKLFSVLIMVVVILSGCASAKQSSPDNALFIIDGRLINKSEADKLTKEQITSITVLKGKAAKSVYGKKAKKGAVIITTKK
jgi:TonB-dependent SusC/RagA subfamily outer membrane receptor